MPIEIKDVDDGLGTLISGTGVLANDELLKAFRKHLMQIPDKRMKYLYSLSDFTRVTKVDVTAKAIQSFAEMCKNASAVTPGTIIALVAGKDMESGPLRMWQKLCEEAEWEIRFFQCNEEARNWLRERLEEKWSLTDLSFGCAGGQ